ncbi:TadE/TadG family type IV pilus assembly protein [Iamia majanohamensis]|uniref:TadE/TadG family type IV pilus assembly protein n=1 Tax=Iamia majanohamensis TaxID=467976 RepID=A0AAF0BT96_9ACTN|nr:TadE/TadG family type IV pilus assembly protein [Iamia majanohamensis]WCO66502.1 TadE/TadG family type IV pilus assembly protein [Iamia majanohamensis]
MARQGGQATVELALALPVVLVGLLLVVQAGLVVAAHVATVHAAREAARAVAVDGRPGVAERAAADAGRPGCRTTVRRPAQPGAVLTVTLACPAPTDVALVGPLLPDPTVEASASMRVER